MHKTGISAPSEHALDPVDVRILDALDRPRTRRELHRELLRRLWHAWAQDAGYEWIEWETDAEPLGARLLALGWARDRGFPSPSHCQVDHRLRKLERLGLVRRLQIPGRRPMLWAKAEGAPLA